MAGAVNPVLALLTPELDAGGDFGSNPVLA